MTPWGICGYKPIISPNSARTWNLFSRLVRNLQGLLIICKCDPGHRITPQCWWYREASRRAALTFTRLIQRSATPVAEGSPVEVKICFILCCMSHSITVCDRARWAGWESGWVGRGGGFGRRRCSSRGNRGAQPPAKLFVYHWFVRGLAGVHPIRWSARRQVQGSVRRELQKSELCTWLLIKNLCGAQEWKGAEERAVRRANSAFLLREIFDGSLPCKEALSRPMCLDRNYRSWWEPGVDSNMTSSASL